MYAVDAHRRVQCVSSSSLCEEVAYARYVHAAWAVGFGVRFGLHVDPDSEGKYIAYYLFIVLSVCAS